MRSITILLLTIMLSLPALAKKKGSPPMAAGALGDRTCAASKCHASYDLNSGNAEIFIEGLPETYTPNEIYEITLSLKQKKAKVFGFQATVSDAEGNAVGQLMSMEGENTQMLDNARYKSRTNRQYITHTLDGIKAPKKGISQTWKIQWQAPDTAAVTPAFYFAFNAANRNNKKTGDHIYTRQLQVLPAPE